MFRRPLRAYRVSGVTEGIAASRCMGRNLLKDAWRDNHRAHRTQPVYDSAFIRAPSRGAAKMAIEYLKRASKTPETESAHAREVAGAMLADIETRGEAAVREY